MMEEQAPGPVPRPVRRRIAGTAVGIGRYSFRGAGTADGGYLIAGSSIV